jgi:hypothetical protein
MEKRIAAHLEKLLDVMPVYTVNTEGMYRNTAKDIINKVEGIKPTKKKPKVK